MNTINQILNNLVQSALKSTMTRMWMLSTLKPDTDRMFLNSDVTLYKRFV